MKNQLRLILLSALTIVALTLAAWGQAAPGTGGPLAGAPVTAVPGAPAPGAPGMPPALGAFQPPAAPAPVPASLDDAWGVACIGDVPGFIDGVGQLASQFQPMINGMMLKGLLGGQFQDPTFEGLPAGSGMVFAFFAPMQVAAFMEVAPAKLDAYVATLQASAKQGGLPYGRTLLYDKADGLLVVGENQAAMAIAKKFAAEVKKRYLDGPGKPALNVTLFPQKGLPIVEPQVLPLLQMASAMNQMQKNQQGANVGVAPQPTPAPGTMTPERMAEAEGRVLLSLAHQTNTLDLTFTPAGGGVRFEMAAVVKADSNLGKFLATPPPKSVGVARIVPARGAVRGALAFDTNAMKALTKSEADSLATQMALTPEEKKIVQEYVDMQSSTQASAMAFDFLVPGGPLMSGSMVSEVADPVKAIADFKDMPKKMQGMMKMNESMGMKMTMDFQENARQVKGVSVHHMIMTMQTDSAKTPPQAEAMMKKMWGDGMNNDVATVDKMLLMAMGGQSIEDLIGAAQAKSNPASRPLAALTVHGPSGQGYVDVDPGLLAKVLVAAFPPTNANPASDDLKPAELVDGLQGAAPVTMAGFWGQGPQTRLSLDIPADLVAKAAALYAKQQANRPGMAGGAGLGAPGAPNAPGIPGAPGAPARPPRPQF